MSFNYFTIVWPSNAVKDLSECLKTIDRRGMVSISLTKPSSCEWFVFSVLGTFHLWSCMTLHYHAWDCCALWGSPWTVNSGSMSKCISGSFRSPPLWGIGSIVGLQRHLGRVLQRQSDLPTRTYVSNSISYFLEQQRTRLGLLCDNFSSLGKEASPSHLHLHSSVLNIPNSRSLPQIKKKHWKLQDGHISWNHSWRSFLDLKWNIFKEKHLWHSSRYFIADHPYYKNLAKLSAFLWETADIDLKV